MAEKAVGFVIDYLTPVLTEDANLPRSVHSQVSEIKLELESIQCFLLEADMKAESEVNTGTTISHGVKAWVKQLRECLFGLKMLLMNTFSIWHNILVVKVASLTPSINLLDACVVKLKPRHRIASQIRNLKVQICEIKERSTRLGFDTIGERSTATPTAVSWYDPRKGAMYLKEAEVMGIESPRAKLICWLLDEQKQQQRSVISVIGMGGLGKTTLAEQVYDSVKEKF